MDAGPDNFLKASRTESFSTNGSERIAAARSVSLVLPAFNEQETIVQAIREADAALAGLVTDYEVLVVDDGSSDETFALASEEAKHRPAVKVLRQPQNLGYGAALRRGFATARCSLIAFTDADCQFDLRELERLILLSRDYEIVCGYRIDRQDHWHRYLYSSAFNRMTRLLLGTRVRDCDCALKLFRREALAELPIEANGFFFNAELLAQARLRGQSLVEVGVTHRPRAAGESKVSLRHVIPVGTAVLRFWWNKILFPAQEPELAEPAQRWSGRFELSAVLLLMLVSFLLLFSRLAYPLIDPDETRYAQIASEMVQTGDWLTPTLEGEPYLDKPPLLYWATAASYCAFGVNETAARLPCAFAALFTVLLTYWLGSRLVGSRGAWCGALALLLSGGFLLSGRFVIMDGPLTLFCLAATLCGYLATRGPTLHLGWWLAAAFACALGVLTKGPIAIVLAVPPLLAVRWFSGSMAKLLLRHWAGYAAVVWLLTAPWFVAVSLADQEFPLYFFWKHNVVRFVHTFHHQQPWWFYLPVLMAGMFPVSLMLPALATFLFQRRTRAACPRTPALGYLLLSAGWVMLFFSLSSCKLPPYILPAFPPLCLLLGSMLDNVVFAPGASTALVERLQRIPRLAGVSAASIAAIAAGVDLCFLQESLAGQLLDGAVLIAAAFGLAAYWRMGAAQSQAAWVCSAAAALAVSAFVFHDLVPEVSSARSVHVEVAELHEQHEQRPVLYFARRSYSAAFHLNSDHIVRFDSNQLAEVGDYLHAHPEVILVTTQDAAESIRESFGSAIELTSASSEEQLYLTHLRKPAAVRLGVKASSDIR